MDQSIKFEPIGKKKTVAVSKHHTFGTDAVLLSSFAAAKRKEKLVDLGTGCGIIPFLMLRDNPEITAFGVDISSEATYLADLGAKENGFSTFTAVNSDLKDLKGKIPFGTHTLVTCNPPYKAEGAGLKSKDSVIRTARHETECTLEDIVSVGAKLLQTGGRFCLCIRPERTAELIVLMNKYKVEPKRIRFAAKYKGFAPWLTLIEGKRSSSSGVVVEPTLYIQDENGDFSKEMIEIYGEYKAEYLKRND